MHFHNINHVALPQTRSPDPGGMNLGRNFLAHHDYAYNLCARCPSIKEIFQDCILFQVLILSLHLRRERTQHPQYFVTFASFLEKVINVPLKTHHDEQKQFTIGHMIDSVMIKECNPTPHPPKKHIWINFIFYTTHYIQSNNLRNFSVKLKFH